jgi:hypothetical protein
MHYSWLNDQINEGVRNVTVLGTVDMKVCMESRHGNISASWNTRFFVKIIR